MNLPTIWPQFFTATILNWKHLLKDDEYKDIIIDCLKFLIDDKRIEVNAFIIISNHVHIIWQPLLWRWLKPRRRQKQYAINK